MPIRPSELSKRHIAEDLKRVKSFIGLCAKILQVDDIPRTKSGKIVELAVRDVVHGRPVKNTEALANPEALTLYQDLPDLIWAVQDGNEALQQFDTSCFSGEYVTGDVTPQYLERLQDERSDAAKLARRERRKLKVVRGS